MDLSTAAAALSDALAALLEADVAVLPEADLLAVVSGVERCRRRLDAVDHVLVAQLDSRGVAATRCLPSTAVLLRDLLNVTPGEAGDRVRAAADLGPRREVSGAPLDPLYPQTASALAAGELSSMHARVIRRALSSLPDVVEKEYGPLAEAVLVDHAVTLHPGQLATLARDLCAALDPDGSLTDEHDRERRRDVTITPRLDGTGALTGTLTPETMAIWQTVLDALSAPAPAEDGLPDQRTAGQRRHDALRDAGWRLLRTNDLPDSGGAPVALQLTVPLEALTARDSDTNTDTNTDSDTGRARPVARTGHGGKLSLFHTDVLTSEAIVLPVGFGIDGGIVSYGRERRLATPAQRRALAARDGGCCFPGCTRPAAWAEVHHIRRWIDGGHTSLDNLCLLCGFHHREFERRGWAVIMLDGVPQWIPPEWLDPERRPRRNTAHHTPIVFRPEHARHDLNNAFSMPLCCTPCWTIVAMSFPISRTHWVVAGALAWAASVIFFVVQAVAQLAFRRPYSLATDKISDLGNTACSPHICSPLHGLVNATFVVVGLLHVFGAVTTLRAWPRSRVAVLAAASLAISGIGLALVGLNPENVEKSLHSSAAGIGLVCLNLAMIGYGVAMERSRLAALTAAAGVAGCVGLVLLAATSAPFGFAERLADYPSAMMIVVLGAVLLARR